MQEPKRDEVLTVKLTAVEKRELEQAARLSGEQTAPWSRDLLLRAARGKRTEVPTDRLEWLRGMMDRVVTLQLEAIRLLHEHTSEHASPIEAQRARERAAGEMARMLERLGFTGGNGSDGA